MFLEELERSLSLDTPLTKQDFILGYIQCNKNGLNILFLEVKKYIFLCKRRSIVPTRNGLRGSLKLCLTIFEKSKLINRKDHISFKEIVNDIF